MDDGRSVPSKAGPSAKPDKLQGKLKVRMKIHRMAKPNPIRPKKAPSEAGPAASLRFEIGDLGIAARWLFCFFFAFTSGFGEILHGQTSCPSYKTVMVNLPFPYCDFSLLVLFLCWLCSSSSLHEHSTMYPS